MRLNSAPLALFLAMTLFHATPASAGEKPAEVPRPPALILAIAVDQFSADLFAQYRKHFSGGLARLQQGAVFASGYQGHAATETCPGHATLLTGVHPARSGIIANWWFDPGIARADKRVYCAEDVSDPASSSRNPVVSAVHLKVPTLGDMIKAANGESRNIAVSGKDRAAIMMGGRTLDHAYWWKGEGFTGLAGKQPARAVAKVNHAAARQIAQGAGDFAVPPWCAARDRPVQVKDFTIGTGRHALPPRNPDAFRISPRLDAATADLAIGLVGELELGARGAPDMLSVSFSATDYVGHAYGSEGVEMCIQLAELDKAIGRLFAELDRRGIDYAVVLSADHGGIDAPERLQQQAWPRATRSDPDLAPAALSGAVARQTGISVEGPLLYADGSFGDVYFSASLTSEQKARVSAALVALLKGHPQVAAVFTARELAEAPLPAGSPQDWSLLDRARASFDARRSGDLVFLLERAVVPVEPRRGITSTHGSPWDYDRRVPILFWRRGLTGFEQPAPVETVDIAPSLAALLGLDAADGAFDGRCLDIDGGARNTCESP